MGKLKINKISRIKEFSNFLFSEEGDFHLFNQILELSHCEL